MVGGARDEVDDFQARGLTVARVMAVVSAVLYMLWVLSPSPLDPRTSFVSELLVHDQPGASQLRATDLLAGLLVTFGVSLVWRARRRLGGDRLWLRAAIVGVGLFGVATIVDALAPLSCTPTASEAGRLAEQQGAVQLHHQIHGVSSAIAGVGVTVGIAATALALRVAACGVRRRLAQLYAAYAAFFVAVTAWVLVEIVEAMHSELLPVLVGLDALGWSQRLQLSAIAGWLLLVAVRPPWRVRPWVRRGVRRGGRR
ncbi:DUF998 domain-containing protein [Arsenicicoccus sp. oral taxon 190]|uniref:DUF998 domain-containing protein n=1 Tax=Arsenicicoccus sp. oral taxon 190 TaxID=1658671 RepID=UPI00067AA286|nr:DUF998 domain-containing protein [Arsenicicoccus sp. oral taxon 190]